MAVAYDNKASDSPDSLFRGTGSLAMLGSMWAAFFSNPWQAIAVLLGACVLAITAWINFGRPWIHRRRLRTPYVVGFTTPLLEKPKPLRTTIGIAQNSEVVVCVRLTPTYNFEPVTMMVHFDGSSLSRPIFLGDENPLQDSLPGKRYVNKFGYFVVEGPGVRSVGNNYILGLRVKTRSAGHFPLHIVHMTKEGESKSSNALVVEVI